MPFIIERVGIIRLVGEMFACDTLVPLRTAAYMNILWKIGASFLKEKCHLRRATFLWTV